jgi:choline-sulfatase
MDALCAAGVRFPHAHTPNPVCVPAREAVVTGRWAHRINLLENGGPRSDHGVPTFPQLLLDSGYATFSAGKQHFRPPRSHRGYGRLHLSEGQPGFRQDDEYLLFVRDNGYGHLTEPGGLRGPSYYLPQYSPLPDHLHMTPWTAAECARFIRANRTRPFFAACAFFKPHPPFDPPRSYWDRYPPESVTLPHVGPEDSPPLDSFLLAQNRSKNVDAPNEARVRAIRSAYYALVEQIDDGIALLVETLRECGILENTCIVISADHGELLGDHLAWGKRSFYEGSVNVPLIMHWPTALPAGAIRETPVNTIDLFPTFLEAAGVSSPPNLDGLSLLPLAREGAPLERPGTAAEYGAERKRKLMWTWQEGDHHYKYTWLANGGREQLFDITTDPHELRNLAPVDSDRCARAHQHLVQWARTTSYRDALSHDDPTVLVSMPFEALPLGEVNKQAPVWPARDPDFQPVPL